MILNKKKNIRGSLLVRPNLGDVSLTKSSESFEPKIDPNNVTKLELFLNLFFIEKKKRCQEPDYIQIIQMQKKNLEKK